MDPIRNSGPKTNKLNNISKVLIIIAYLLINIKMGKRIIKINERQLNKIVKRVLSESYEGGIIQQGDDSCEIRCKRKLAKNGSNGDVVKYIQHLLAANGFNQKYAGGGMGGDCYDSPTACDGKYRRHTKDAVMEFQRKYGLTPDGVVGYDTLKKMCDVFKPKPGTIINSVEAWEALCKDCNCQDDYIDDYQDDYIDDYIDDDQQIGVDIDCDDLRDCVDKYIFGRTKPDFDNFLTCLYKGDPNKKDKSKGDMDEKDWGELEMDGFIEECAWYIKSNALSSGRKYVRECPDQVDCMPGPGKGMRFCNSKFLQACKSKGCTKVTY